VLPSIMTTGSYGQTPPLLIGQIEALEERLA
jgi:hypothetical protein